MQRTAISEQLIGTGASRRLADAGLRHFARWRQRATDRLQADQVQHDCLLRLVRRARDTRFGHEHDFAGIRTIADYQRQVPLRSYEDFWNGYWQLAAPGAAGVTWPQAVPYLALSSGTTSGTTKYIPVSREMLRSNRLAALTAVAWFRTAYPEAGLLSGRMFFLGGSTDLRPVTCGPFQARKTIAPLAGDLSGIAAKEVSTFLRPFTFPPLELALETNWEQKLTMLAEQSARLPITLVAGVPSWLLVLFERLRQVTGRQHIADIWPTLRVVMHGGTKFDPYRNLFRKVIGNDDVHYLETYPASEGFVAAEDPRFGLLRLIVDHNIFFEFVPVGELKSDRPTRHTVAEIEPGVQYAVVLTTCAGLWGYVLGDTVCFEQCDPPLLRFTGRVQQYLSAFGEHLIGEEVERAVAAAAEQTGTTVVDFHVGPVFPKERDEVGRHRFFIETVGAAPSSTCFAEQLDAVLSSLNEDYRAHRVSDLTLGPPEVCLVRHGGFADWMRSRGKLGGQHKVPRLDNTGQVTAELSRYLEAEACHDLSRVG